MLNHLVFFPSHFREILIDQMQNHLLRKIVKLAFGTEDQLRNRPSVWRDRDQDQDQDLDQYSDTHSPNLARLVLEKSQKLSIVGTCSSLLYQVR